MTGTAEHGTRTSYRYGCRCPRCGSAEAEYMRDYRHNRRRDNRVRVKGVRPMDVSDAIDEIARVLHGI